MIGTVFRNQAQVLPSDKNIFYLVFTVSAR